MDGPSHQELSRRAAELRKNATDVERLIWGRLRNRQLAGFKFRFQEVIAPYIVDFFCHESALIVEVDGSQHSEAADAVRTAFLDSKGCRVLRFWNSEVIDNLDGVVLTIQAAAEARTWREMEE